MRLDFLIPGFAKCGTTTLCALLGEHPEIFMPEQKDYRLFDLDDYEPRWEDFEACFADADSARMVGEGSIWYTLSETERLARDRLLAHFPELRFIFIARDPVERLESSFRDMHHSQSKYGVYCPFDLGEALARFPSLLEDSAYRARLGIYRERGAPERVLVLLLEELERDPRTVLQRCFRFLGVDPDAEIPDPGRRLNHRGQKLRDTEQWRQLQSDPAVDRCVEQIPHQVRLELLAWLGLRQPFPEGPLDWDSQAVALVRERLAADALGFLADQGRPLSIWPRLAEMLGPVRDDR